MSAIPPPPRDGPRLAAPVPLRFEDVTQDGRLALEALPNALASTVWRPIVAGEHGAQGLRSRGIVPILVRLRLEGTPGPFSANSIGVEAEGTFRYSRADDGRFMLDMWADLYAPVGRTYGSAQGTAERVLAGRILAEHVLTRPFEAPEQRRVTSLDFPGAPLLGDPRPALPAFENIATLPDGAQSLDREMRLDPLPAAFGIVHTDSNRHVNSLVYLRLFEEAALRRLVTLGRRSDVLARSVDIAYRKPCFAGQSMRLAQRAFEHGGRVGVAAVLVTEADAADPSLALARPHVFARMTLEA